MSNRICSHLLYLRSAAVPGWTFSKCPAERKAVTVVRYSKDTLMDETIHIYLDALHKTDTHTISSTKTRLWPSILVSLRWIFKHPISGSTIIQNGLGLLVINNLAIAVEGFITDILVDYFDNNELKKSPKIEQIENSNWTSKVKHYNKIFPNKLDKCDSYKSIEILFLLRNNTAHGRTHRETNSMNIATQERTKIESTNVNYQKVRKFFNEVNVMKESEIYSNVETLWKLNNVLFLIGQVQIFLNSVLENNKSEKFTSIASELNNAYKMTIS